MTKPLIEFIEREDEHGVIADTELIRIPLLDVRAMAEKGVDRAEAVAYLAGSKYAFSLVANVPRVPELLRLGFKNVVDCYELVIYMVEMHGLESAQAEIEKLPKTKVAQVMAEA